MQHESEIPQMGKVALTITLGLLVIIMAMVIFKDSSGQSHRNHGLVRDPIPQDMRTARASLPIQEGSEITNAVIYFNTSLAGYREAQNAKNYWYSQGEMNKYRAAEEYEYAHKKNVLYFSQFLSDKQIEEAYESVNIAIPLEE